MTTTFDFPDRDNDENHGDGPHIARQILWQISDEWEPVEKLGGSCAIDDRKFHDEKNANFVAGEKVQRPEMGEYAEPPTDAEIMAEFYATRKATQADAIVRLTKRLKGNKNGPTD